MGVRRLGPPSPAPKQGVIWVGTPPPYSSTEAGGYLFLGGLKGGMRLKPGAGSRTSSSPLDPHRSEPRAVPRARLAAGSWRMLRALSDLVLLHLRIPQGWALSPRWEPQGWGASSVGGPLRQVASPQPHVQAAGGGGGGGLQGWRAPRCCCCCCPDGTRFSQHTLPPSERRSFEENGEFSPLLCGIVGLKHREGSGPGGCGAGAERSTPVPLPLEPSRGHSVPADKGLHYLCSACQRSSAAAGQRGRQPARAEEERSKAECCGGHPGGFGGIAGGQG